MIHSIFDALVALAATVGILDYFGIKPKQVPSWRVMPLSRKWKLAMMLMLVAAALGMSGYSFYRAWHPKIIERVVEKEKPVPIAVPCPEPLNKAPAQTKSRKATPTSSPQQSGKNNVQAGPITQGFGSIAQVGGSGNSATVINTPPSRTMNPDQYTKLVELLKKAGPLKVVIRHANLNWEAEQYYDYFDRAFRAAQWNVVDETNARLIPEVRQGRGLQLQVHDVNHAPPSAVAIQKSLKMIGIDIGGVSIPDFDDSTVLIYVGVQ